jgi:N utilization substance protein A
MNAEFIAMLDYLERERGIKRDVLVEAVENALLSAAKKSVEAIRRVLEETVRPPPEIRAPH